MHKILSDIALKKWCRMKKTNSMRFTMTPPQKVDFTTATPVFNHMKYKYWYWECTRNWISELVTCFPSNVNIFAISQKPLCSYGLILKSLWITNTIIEPIPDNHTNVFFCNMKQHVYTATCMFKVWIVKTPFNYQGGGGAGVFLKWIFWDWIFMK